MKILFLFLFATSLQAVAAESPSSCGTYKLKGRLTSPADSPGKVVFVVNEKNQAETRFEIPDGKDFQKVASHVNQFLELTATVKKPVSGMRGKISDVKEIHLQIRKSLTDVGMKQIKSAACED